MAAPVAKGSMQTSAPRGFSLIEVLVVLAIAGILLTGVTISLRQTDTRQLDQELQRLGSIVSLTAERASVTGRDHRLQITESGYRIEQFADLEWTVVTASPFGARQWPRAFQTEPSNALVQISAQGLVTPFTFQLSLGSERRQLSLDALGRPIHALPVQ